MQLLSIIKTYASQVKPIVTVKVLVLVTHFLNEGLQYPPLLDRISSGAVELCWSDDLPDTTDCLHNVNAKKGTQ